MMHDSFLIRPGTADDHGDERESVRRLAVASLDCEPDAADLPELLAAGPDADPELQLVALRADQVVGYGVATLPPPTGDSRAVGYIDLLAVAPTQHGQGVGRALLAALEERLRARGATAARVGGNAPCYAWPGVDVRYTAMLQLLGTAGYARVAGSRGEAVNMSVDLTGAPSWLDTAEDEARLAASGVDVRRADPADPAFGRMMARWGPKLTWETLRAAERTPSACHVALRQGTDEHVAFACHHSNRAGWFGPMGTDASARRLGIGSVLLRRCLADLAGEGRAGAEISWVGPVGFYARGVAARIDRVFWLFNREL